MTGTVGDAATPPTRADLRARRSGADGGIVDDPEHTVLGARRLPPAGLELDRTVLASRHDATAGDRHEHAVPADGRAASDAGSDDPDDDMTRLAVRARADETALAAGRTEADDATWQRGASERPSALTGEPTQASTTGVPTVIEAPRRRANFEDEPSEPIRTARVPIVIDVVDVYPPRAPHDPLAGHIAMDPAERGPQQPVDGARVQREQHRRSRRRLVVVVATIVGVWCTAAVGLLTLLVGWPFD